MLTLVRYLPEWFPGAGFKKAARAFSARVNEFIDKPMAFVRHQIVGLPSFEKSNLFKDTFVPRILALLSLHWRAVFWRKTSQTTT